MVHFDTQLGWIPDFLVSLLWRAWLCKMKFWYAAFPRLVSPQLLDQYIDYPIKNGPLNMTDNLMTVFIFMYMQPSANSHRILLHFKVRFHLYIPYYTLRVCKRFFHASLLSNDDTSIASPITLYSCACLMCCRDTFLFWHTDNVDDRYCFTH